MLLSKNGKLQWCLCTSRQTIWKSTFCLKLITWIYMDTPDGKNQFYQTSQVFFHKITIAVPNPIISQNDSLKPIEQPMKVEIKEKPSRRGESFLPFSKLIDVNETQQYKTKDPIWHLWQVVEEKKIGILPTCSRYNSPHWYLQLNIHVPLVWNYLFTHNHQPTRLVFILA